MQYSSKHHVALIAILTLLSVNGSAQTSSDEENRARDAFIDWASESALPMEKWKLGDAHTAYLDRAMGDKRIVFIGESDHGIHEKFDVQAMLIRHLASRGFTHVFYEGLGTGVAGAYDQLIQEGGNLESVFELPDELSEIADADPSRFGRGRHRSSLWSPDLRQRSNSERAWLFAELQAHNASRLDGQEALHLQPLDIDTRTHFCKASIDALLHGQHERSAVRELLELLPSEEGETIASESKRLSELRALSSRHELDLRSLLGTQAMDELQAAIDCLTLSTEFLGLLESGNARTEALRLRETFMFEQFARRFDALPEDAKVVIIGHNMHLSKESDDLGYPFGETVGARITQAYPGEIFSLWVLFDRGRRYSQSSQAQAEFLPSDPERIESALVEAGETFLLPLHTGDERESYLDTPRTFHASFRKITATITKQADAFLFLDEVTELQHR